MRAGLQGYVCRSAARPSTGIRESDRFGMRATATGGSAPADDLAGGIDDHATDIGIGCALSARAVPQPYGLSHEPPVGGHIPNVFSSFLNCSCRALSAASCSAWSFFWSAMISASVRLADQLST